MKKTFGLINKEVWDYLDGNGFHLMSTMYTDLVNNYGKSSSIDEFAQKGQLLGAINSKSIWEVWNYNKLDYGDRFCSGLLFWYHKLLYASSGFSYVGLVFGTDSVALSYC